jgi:hypothetical protein
MALTQGQKDALLKRVQTRWSDARTACPFTKAQLIAAADAADTWLDANKTEYNSALPVAFRNAASTEQKGLLLAYVVLVFAGLTAEDL